MSAKFMLDGLYKAKINKFWDALARSLVKLGFTPNAVTWAGLVLIIACCAAFYFHRSNMWFGISLSVVFFFDALDGAVARVRNMETKYGGYLDATVDRYQELLVYATLAWMYDFWIVCFFAITGSILTSYNKARTAVEIPIDNNQWPDLLERFERLFILCAALIFEPLLRFPETLPHGVVYYALFALAVLTHITAAQRFLRARRLLRDAARSDRGNEAKPESRDFKEKGR